MTRHTKTFASRSTLAPTVHLNGTSAAELEAQLEAAANALLAAEKALEGAAPNGRDYYPQGPTAFAAAAGAHQARVTRVRDVRAEIVAIWEVVLEGGAK